MFHFLCTFRRRGILLNTSFESLETTFFKNKNFFSSEYSEGLYHNLKSEQGEKTSENIQKKRPKIEKFTKFEKVMILRTVNAFYGFNNIFDCK